MEDKNIEKDLVEFGEVVRLSSKQTYKDKFIQVFIKEKEVLTFI